MTTLRTTGSLLLLLMVAGGGCSSTRVSSSSDPGLAGMQFRNAAVVVSPDTGPSFEAARTTGETALVQLLPEFNPHETSQVLPSETLLTLLEPTSLNRWARERGYDGLLFVSYDSSTSKTLPPLEGVDQGSVHRVSYSVRLWALPADRELWSARIDRRNAASSPKELKAVSRVIAKELRKAWPRPWKAPNPASSELRLATIARR